MLFPMLGIKKKQERVLFAATESTKPGARWWQGHQRTQLIPLTQRCEKVTSICCMSFVLLLTISYCIKILAPSNEALTSFVRTELQLPWPLFRQVAFLHLVGHFITLLYLLFFFSMNKETKRHSPLWNILGTILIFKLRSKKKCTRWIQTL